MVQIIAEAGVNHNGEIKNAIKMIDIAASAGADIIKFQTFKTESLVTKTAEIANYQKNNVTINNTQYTLLKSLELSESDHRILIKHCKKNNIEFLSTAFDVNSLKMLVSLGQRKFKIPSGENNNLLLLKEIANYNYTTYLSTGMTSFKDLKFLIKFLIENGLNKKNLIVLHCNSAYPTPFDDVNLLSMFKIKDEFKVRVGLSDHTLGIEVPIAAAALGADVIEKHFTLNKKMKGPDHSASIEPSELDKMITSIKNVIKSLGNNKKLITKSEKVNIVAARKSIVARKK